MVNERSSLKFIGIFLGVGFFVPVPVPVVVVVLDVAVFGTVTAAAATALCRSGDYKTIYTIPPYMVYTGNRRYNHNVSEVLLSHHFRIGSISIRKEFRSISITGPKESASQQNAL